MGLLIVGGGNNRKEFEGPCERGGSDSRGGGPEAGVMVRRGGTWGYRNLKRLRPVLGVNVKYGRDNRHYDASLDPSLPTFYILT
jgi:hypothetical protein